MKLVSIQVGGPREVEWRGKTVLTSIFKAPVAGRVRVGALNLEGDQQSDLTVHGGRDKSVYVYPSEHYPFWRSELPEASLEWGSFGENLTTEGLLEDRVCIGDQLRCGSAVFAVTQPRLPCFKLGIRLGRPDIAKRFQRSGRSGFYLTVLQQGEIGAGDALALQEAPGERISISELMRLAVDADTTPEQLRRMSELPGLAESWRDHFRERLA